MTILEVATQPAKKLEDMTVLELRERCKEVGVVGYSRMRKSEMIQAIQEKERRPVAPPLEVNPPGEKENNHPWKDHFIQELYQVCVNLESLPEQTFYPQHIQAVIDQIEKAEKVEDLANLDDQTIYTFMGILRHEIPKYHANTYRLIKDISRATPFAGDIDFI